MKTIIKLFLITFCLTSLSLTLPEKVKITNPTQLGEKLFFDNILSGNYTRSCASCHIPAYAFADTVAYSSGVDGKFTKRNTPSVMNMAARDLLFWDGRAKNLQEQVLFPIQDANEMNCPIDSAIARLNSSKVYLKLFKAIYKKKPDANNLGNAIASFEKSLETSNTANDRWLRDKPNGLSAQQQKGRSIFFNKGKCIECHFTPDFTGDEFKSIGLFDGQKWNDSGRYYVTKKAEDIGKFKVPGLRNVAITAPYMHDGSFKTLEEVIRFYNKPTDFINNKIPRDSLLLQPLELTEMEMLDLEKFLIGLTEHKFLDKLKPKN
jgi:cytochrome c peroxidase